MSFSEKVIHHEGWLEKQSPSQVKGWQKRWVVLHQNTLKYWRDQEEYRAEASPSGCILAHTENVLEFSVKVLKSRTEIRRYVWRIWTGSEAAHRKATKGKNSVSAVAWNARVTWVAFLDDWCEKHLAERIFSRFHVRKPASFLDEVMGLDQEGEDHANDAAAEEQDVKLVQRRGELGRRFESRDERSVSTLESYLDKRSPGFFALWQRRWFVYLEAEDMIVYYKSREEYLHGSEPVGSFQIADLNTVQGVGGLDGRELHIETITAPQLNDLQPPRAISRPPDSPASSSVKIRTYKLRALTTESRDQWVSQLKARIGNKSKAVIMRRMQSLHVAQVAHRPSTGLSRQESSREESVSASASRARSVSTSDIAGTIAPSSLLDSLHRPSASTVQLEPGVASSSIV